MRAHPALLEGAAHGHHQDIGFQCVDPIDDLLVLTLREVAVLMAEDNEARVAIPEPCCCTGRHPILGAKQEKAVAMGFTQMAELVDPVGGCHAIGKSIASQPGGEAGPVAIQIDQGSIVDSSAIGGIVVEKIAAVCVGIRYSNRQVRPGSLSPGIDSMFESLEQVRKGSTCDGHAHHMDHVALKMDEIQSGVSEDGRPPPGKQAWVDLSLPQNPEVKGSLDG